MDVDHDEHDGVASRDAGRRPAADQTEEEEEEFPPNPNKCVPSLLVPGLFPASLFYN